MKILPLLYIVGEGSFHNHLTAANNALFRWEERFEYKLHGLPRRGAHVRRYESLEVFEEEQPKIIGQHGTFWPVQSRFELVPGTEDERAALVATEALKAENDHLKVENLRLTAQNTRLAEACALYIKEERERQTREAADAETLRLRLEAQRRPGEIDDDSAVSAPPPPADAPADEEDDAFADLDGIEDDEEEEPADAQGQTENVGNDASAAEKPADTAAPALKGHALKKQQQAQRREAARLEAQRRQDAKKAAVSQGDGQAQQPQA